VPTFRSPIVKAEVATTPTAPTRLPGLDLLRAVAISWVMAYHASSFGLISRDHWIAKFDWMGVDLFFVLSGFLIAGQLLRPWARGHQPDYSRFFARRLLRTVPAYLAVVALYFLFPVLRERPVIQPLWQFLTFTQNFGYVPDPPKAFSHAWSLCVEEQFYLVFPMIVAILAVRPRPRRVVGVFIAVLIVGIVSRGYFWLADVAAAVRHSRFPTLRSLHDADLLPDMGATRRAFGGRRGGCNSNVSSRMVEGSHSEGKHPRNRRRRRCRPIGELFPGHVR
jgi:peptidoglycan/LPS O-acetylase OafA/YrhL